MSSRRKASTPCMIRPEKTVVEFDDDEEEESQSTKATEGHTKQGITSPPLCSNIKSSTCLGVNGKDSALEGVLDKPAADPPDPSKPQRKQQGGYECKYCPFSTQNLDTFKEHVDSSHPNVILNPLYLCAVCNFNTKKFDTLTSHNERRHPGEKNFKFKRIRRNNQTILEQTIEGCSSNAAVLYNTASATATKGQKLGAAPQSQASKVKVASADKVSPDLSKKPLTALNVNGTVIIPDAALLKAGSLSHIMPSLQQPLNYTQVPKIAVPLNTTKYNPSLDDNLTLMSSFNKFPYPTQAELSWLTAASKHPEEQIKVWFTAQRLKQGISWSPEEVEEARKKMFNGTISTVPQTLAVVAPPVKSHSSSVSKPQQTTPVLPCQLLSQTSLVLTPVANGSTVTCSPLALTVANQVAQSLKRPLASPLITTESKRPSIIQTVSLPVVASKPVGSKPLSFTADPNKTAEQHSVLRSSYGQCPFPEEDEIYRLIETTGLSRGEIKKWFSEQRLLNLKNGPAAPTPVKPEASVPVIDGPVKKAVPGQFPLLERVKGKSSDQLKALEESFQKSNSPTEAELGRLAQDTRLSQTEVDCWFSERRALRDNMEKVLLSMTPRHRGDKPERPEAALPNGGSHRELNGKAADTPEYTPVLAPPSSSSSSSSSSPPLLAASSPQPPTHSSTASPPVLTSSRSSPHPPNARTSVSSLLLLKEMFSRTQWPSPDEYSQLETQTSLGRTDIVRWFKEHRAALKSGESLDWMEDFQKVPKRPAAGREQNGQSAERTLSSSAEVRGVKAPCTADGHTETSKLSRQDKLQWLTDRLVHGVADLSQRRPDHSGSSTDNKEKWVKVTVAVGEGSSADVERHRLAPDSEALPGRVTG